MPPLNIPRGSTKGKEKGASKGKEEGRGTKGKGCKAKPNGSVGKAVEDPMAVEAEDTPMEEADTRPQGSGGKRWWKAVNSLRAAARCRNYRSCILRAYKGSYLSKEPKGYVEKTPVAGP